MSARKNEEERAVLAMALPLLQQLYGELQVDPVQIDRPDAALVIANGNRVAVEMTSLDCADDKQYWNDKAYGSEVVDAQLNRMMSGKSPINQPTKSMKVDLARDYIVRQALPKAVKHDAYMAAGIYAESVLLTTSDYISARHPGFVDYYVPMASHLFHAAKFPFNKVLFVCMVNGSATLVYDKSAAPTSRPRDALFPDQHEEVSRVIGAIGQTVQLYGIPLVPKVFRPKKKRKRRPSKSS